MSLDGARVIFVALIAAIGCTLLMRHWVPSVVLILLSVAWPFVDSSMEGPVLWVLSPGHGLVLSDLLAPLGVLVAAARLYLRWRQRRAGHPLPAQMAAFVAITGDDGSTSAVG
ncbi:MAG: hypothetical protein ACR2P2_01130 [Nakamurella sp.]